MSSPLDPFGPFRAAYNVHPECTSFVEKAASMKLQPYAALTVETAREQHDRVGRAMGGSVDFDGTVTHQTIPSPALHYDDSGTGTGIHVTVYKPSSISTRETPTIIFVYFHGGGLVVGSLVSYDTALKVIASKSGAIVVFVHYRLLPLPHAPTAPFDDALTSVRWVLDNKLSLTGRTDCNHCKVGVGGDSAGGHLTASVTSDKDIRSGIDFQVLVYPMADVSRKQASFQEFEMCPGLTKSSIDWFFSHSIDHIRDAVSNPRINPMACTNLQSSPPALMLLAEMDALRDGGLEYAKRLQESQVQVEIETVVGVPHAFFQMPEVFKSNCDFAYSRIAEFIRCFQ